MFLFPSFYEGLPLVLIEAQAAGLPCVISSTISMETDIEGSRIRRLSLSLSANKWATEALTMLEDAPKRISQVAALNPMADSTSRTVSNSSSKLTKGTSATSSFNMSL